MSPQHRHFRSLISSYATVRPQRRRELKLLSLPDYFSSCFNTPQISCYHSGHLRLVSSPGPCERATALVGCHSSYSTSSHGGRDNNAIGNKEKSKRRKRKQTAKQGVLSRPSEEELSTGMVNNLYQSGDPLGRKELGQHVVQWLKQGMHLMASKFASSDQSVTQDNDPLWFDGHMGFVMQAQAYLSATPMPKGQEALCLKASTHYPTLFDNFQRELRDVLLQQQEEGLVTDWRSTRSWMLLKEMARSTEHRTAARRSATPVMHSSLGISLDRTRLMQSKIDEFVQKMTGLLQLERDAELEVTQTTKDELTASSMMDGKSKKPVEYLVTHGQAQEECDTICNLKVVSSSIGLTGQHLVLFRVEGRHKLPPTRLSPGDKVCVRTCDSQGEVATTSCMEAFVHNLGEDGCSITVALKSRRGDPTFSKFLGKIVRIDRLQALADAVTYERNCEALMILQKRGLQKRNASIGVVATLFGDKEDVMKLEGNNLMDCGGSEVPDDGLLERHSYSFDASQSRALALALDKERPVLVIQGPPGTGKTSLLSYLIACVVRQGERVLVTAPSNAAIDNIVESLSRSGLNIVRVGNPSRISPSVTSMSLGEIVTKRLEKFTQDFERKKYALRKDLKRCIQDNDSLASGIRQRLKKLGKDYKNEEKEAIREVLSNAEVVLSTNTGAADPLIRGIGCFDLVIIDEAGQATEPSCWIPILQGKRCILAGDHRQLAPVVLSREAMEGGLGVSLLERVSSLHDGLLTTTLTTQYRMHESIASWASKEMYDGLLQSFPSVASRLLVDYPFVKATWMTQCALLLLDTRKAYGSLNIDCEESLDPAGTGSFYNNGEADIVAHHVLNLIQCGGKCIVNIANIPTLNGSNYRVWREKYELKLALGEVDFAIISACPAEPEDPERDENKSDADFAARKCDHAEIRMKYDLEHRQRTLSNHKCLLVAKATIEEQIRGSIPECATAIEYLDKIKSQFTGSTKATASSLIKKLVNEKYTGGSIREHILKMNTTTSKLKEMNLKEDDFLIHLIFAYLPKEYDTFIVNYNMQPERWVIERLISMYAQEERIKSSHDESAHFVKDNKRKNFNGKNFKPQGKPKWDKASSSNSQGKKPQDSENQQNNSYGGAEKDQCKHCFKKGHYIQEGLSRLPKISTKERG